MQINEVLCYNASNAPHPYEAHFLYCTIPNYWALSTIDERHREFNTFNLLVTDSGRPRSVSTPQREMRIFKRVRLNIKKKYINKNFKLIDFILNALKAKK